MAKTVPLTLRKPPEASQAGIEAFVREGVPKRSNVQALKRSDVQTSKAVVTRADGRRLRRMTIYLPTELAARLRVHCADIDVDASTFLAELAAERLNA